MQCAGKLFFLLGNRGIRCHRVETIILENGRGIEDQDLKHVVRNPGANY